MRNSNNSTEAGFSSAQRGNEQSGAPLTAPAPLTDELAPLPEAGLWMTNESKYRLANGGNSKGAVPVHSRRSATSTIPLYTAEQMRDYARTKAAPAAPVQTDREARQRVAKALGLQGCTDGKYSFAWEYLLDCIEECAKEADDVVSPVQPEKPLVFDDFPEFNEQAMGCGLEDRGITDRYEAMRYGFEEALDLVDERIKNFLADFAAPAVAAPVQAEQAAAVRAALEEAASKLNETSAWDNLRALAYPSTADKASEVRAAEVETEEWSYSTDEEQYHEQEPSRRAIIQHALAELEERDDGSSSFWIGRNVRFTGKGDAGSIIDALQEQAYEECGEFAETYLQDVTAAEESELESLVTSWAKRVDRSNFWTVTAVEHWTVEQAREYLAAPSTADKASEVRTDYSIRPVKVERDANGWWSHPAIPNFDEDHKSFAAWVKAVGLEVKCKCLESYPEHPLYDAWFDHGECNASSWEPEEPAGEGWFTFSIHDSEDGPVWVWARPIAAPSTADSANTGALGGKGAEA